MRGETLDLFGWRPMETTPTPERYTAAANPKPRDYRAAWMTWASDHPTEAREILAMAVSHLPDTRCSVDGLFLAIRKNGVAMNHSWRAAAADWLIAQEPRLADVIERRKRKATR